MLAHAPRPDGISVCQFAVQGIRMLAVRRRPASLNASGERIKAAEQLLEIQRRDRNWSDEKARKQLLQFFEAWGGADEATVEGRKRLSTILFS